MIVHYEKVANSAAWLHCQRKDDPVCTVALQMKPEHSTSRRHAATPTRYTFVYALMSMMTSLIRIYVAMMMYSHRAKKARQCRMQPLLRHEGDLPP